MKKTFYYLVVFMLNLTVFSQNNYIVKTEDGRRVLLKSDYTWEFIDLAPVETKDNEAAIETKEAPIITNNDCDADNNFKEPNLNLKTQALLKRSRSDINNLKKKVAKKEKCELSDIKLIKVSETKAKGYYTFCTCNGKVAYKRNGSSFFKKGKLF